MAHQPTITVGLNDLERATLFDPEAPLYGEREDVWEDDGRDYEAYADLYGAYGSTHMNYDYYEED